MVRRLGSLTGASITHAEGELGSVRDLYFDDEAWTVRWAVVRTGSWLSGRDVLLSIMSLSLSALNVTPPRLETPLTRDTIRNGPDVGAAPPVSRLAETRLLTYYGHPLYWRGPALWGPVPAPAMLAHKALSPPSRQRRDERRGMQMRLHSVNELAGYRFESLDRDVGKVDDLLVDGDTWQMRFVVVDIDNGPGGQSVMVPTEWITRVSWPDRRMHVKLSRERILASPASDSAIQVET